MTDSVFHGPPDLVKSAADEALSKGDSALGPRTLDGVSYVNIRSKDGQGSIPEGCVQTGPQLSQALLGMWFDAIPKTTPTETKE